MHHDSMGYQYIYSLFLKQLSASTKSAHLTLSGTKANSLKCKMSRFLANVQTD